MLEHLRAHWTKVMSPPAKLLLRLHVTPDMITWTGTIGVVIVSVLFFPQGWLWQGAILLGFLVVSDSLDGIMARTSGRSSDWGAFLDSCLDRIADGAVFGGIALYYVGKDANTVWATLAIAALIFGQVTSYTKARGESLGYTVNGGLAGRADRLLVGLIGVLFTITLPTVATGLARGTALALARCLGEFGATLTFAGSLQGVTRTMPLEIYLAREADSGTALTLGVVLIVAAAVIVALTEWPGRRRRPAAEDEPASPTPTDVPDPAGQQRAAAVPVHVDGAVTARDWQVSLDIPAGRVVAVMGRNGAGKSTLAQVLAGALALDSGTASIGPQVHDTATTFTPARRRGVAMVRQDPQVFAHLSVLANVAYPLRARGVPRAAARRAAHAQLAAVGADQLAFRRGDELSGGQAARVSLARALVFDPRLLILDEPTSALDVQARARVTQVLADRLAHRGTTTVLITHDVVEAVRLASWLVVLEHGRVAEQGEPARLLAAPTTDFTARLAGLNIVSGALIVGADALPGIAIGSRRLAAARIDPDSLFPGTLSPGELFPGALPPDALAPDTPLSDSMPPDSMPSASTAPGAGFPAPGSPVSLVFAPEAVSLFRVPQQGSPRSLLPGVVQAVDAASGLVTVRVALDDGPVISARITPAAWAELQLAVGQRLWCSVKATQVRLVPAPAPVGP